MNCKIKLTLILSLIFLAVRGQTTSPFLKQFKQTSLPVCIKYTHEEQIYFGAIYHTDTIDGELQDVFEKNDNYQKDSLLLLSKEFVKMHLLPNTKYIYRIDDNKKDTLGSELIDDYLNSDFYAISSIPTVNTFHIVIYERIFSISDIRSSEKFICTITKSGKFIYRNLIASFTFSGTSITNSGGRVPWFPLEYGCINRDLTINKSSENYGEIKYKILPDGKIVITK